MSETEKAGESVDLFPVYEKGDSDGKFLGVSRSGAGIYDMYFSETVNPEIPSEIVVRYGNNLFDRYRFPVYQEGVAHRGEIIEQALGVAKSRGYIPRTEIDVLKEACDGIPTDELKPGGYAALMEENARLRVAILPFLNEFGEGHCECGRESVSNNFCLEEGDVCDYCTARTALGISNEEIVKPPPDECEEDDFDDIPKATPEGIARLRERLHEAARQEQENTEP